MIARSLLACTVPWMSFTLAGTNVSWFVFVADENGQLQDSSSLDKTLDVFISYRRSNGSHLARYVYKLMNWFFLAVVNVMKISCQGPAKLNITLEIRLLAVKR